MMTTVRFKDEDHYDFAEEFLQGAKACSFDVQFHLRNLEIQVNHAVAGRLLERVNNLQSVVLPYCGSKTDHWIITSADRRQLDQTLARVSKLVVPSYAEFATPSQMPQLKLFDPDMNRLQELGTRLYGAGYYSWRSPTQYRSVIFDRLNLWLDLEDRQPALRRKQTSTYHALHETFEIALAAANWSEAEACLHEMQRLNLSTADNLMFLGVQLLAQQQKWHMIWQHPHFATLARLRMPRAVRAALLTAFHHTQLLPLEQKNDWQSALNAVQEARPRLGTLLTGRFGLLDGPVVRVFAYLSVLSKDQNSLAELAALDSDLETKRCVEALEKLLPPAPEPTTLVVDPLSQARLALLNTDYDSAIRATDRVKDAVDRALLLMELAFHSNDPHAADRALIAYAELSSEQREDLHERHQHVERYVDFLGAVTAPEAQAEEGLSAVTTPAIKDWLDWFEQVEVDPDAPHIAPALEYLKTVTDDRSWTPEKVQLLSQKLFSFVVEPARHSRPSTRNALQHLTAFFLKDASFPREEEAYGDLYEMLLLGLLEQRNVNETNSLAMLRLAEAILRRAPERSDELLDSLHSWFAKPIPALENYVIEAFELLAEYGLEGWRLADWYRDWVSYLLDLPTSRDRVSLEAWQAFGNWIQLGDDLLHRLDQSLRAVIEQQVDNPVEGLPAGYRIGIFSLRASSAERAKQLLLKRNSDLDVRVCLEKDLSPQAKSIAQNSEMVVIVTTCISHALTYGIQPYLANDPVYPISSGSTSIIRAIEDYLVKDG